MVFIKAKAGPPNIGDPKGMFTVQYFDEKGNMIIRSGGTRAWRCNNPGNLLRGNYMGIFEMVRIGTHRVRIFLIIKRLFLNLLYINLVNGYIVR